LQVWIGGVPQGALPLYRQDPKANSQILDLSGKLDNITDYYLETGVSSLMLITLNDRQLRIFQPFQLIDIGTGYYVEKDLAASKEYFNKKVKFVTEQMEKIQVRRLTLLCLFPITPQ
jgi:hypothetical protein